MQLAPRLDTPECWTTTSWFDDVICCRTSTASLLWSLQWKIRDTDAMFIPKPKAPPISLLDLLIFAICINWIHYDTFASHCIILHQSISVLQVDGKAEDISRPAQFQAQTGTVSFHLGKNIKQHQTTLHLSTFYFTCIWPLLIFKKTYAVNKYKTHIVANSKKNIQKTWLNNMKAIIGIYQQHFLQGPLERWSYGMKQIKTKTCEKIMTKNSGALQG